MHAREDTHRHMTRIVADEHLINFENRTEFPIQHLSRDVRQIEINLILTAHPLALDADLEYLSGGNITRNEITVGRILLFEKIPTLVLRYGRRRSSVARVSRYPDATAFAARRFRHQTQLVFAGN